MDLTVAAARVAVRPIREADLGPLMAVNGDDEVTRYLPYKTWQTQADARAWYDRMMGLQARGEAEQLVLVERANDVAIGTVLVFRFDEARENAELGYTLARSHWGRGYMFEALSALLDGGSGLKSLNATVELGNAASLRLLERLGFVRTGADEEVIHWKVALPRPGSGATTPAARHTRAEKRG